MHPNDAGSITESVTSRWSKVAVKRSTSHPIHGWLDSPLVQNLYVQPLVSGSPDENWLASLVNRLGLPSRSHWLSIACGGGGLELFAMEAGLCSELDGADIADGAIEVAREAAAARGIAKARFEVADL